MTKLRVKSGSQKLFLASFVAIFALVLATGAFGLPVLSSFYPVTAPVTPPVTSPVTPPNPTSTPTPTPTFVPTPTPTPVMPTPTATPIATPTPTPVANYLINGSFEADLDGNLMPDSWRRTIGTNSGLDIRTSNYSFGGSYSFKFVGSVTAAKYIYQKVDHSFAAGQIFYLSSWAKAVNSNTTGLIQAKAVVTYKDTTTQTFISNFPRGGSYGWTNRITSFTLPKNAAFITVYVGSVKQSGIVYFDSVVLANTLPTPPPSLP